ncbi:MAG: PorV/PorQ family protein [Elusimicrobia bacterium]|nr:PorV/PorQ family protein [Elusimicrobiota bacterium]
MTMKIAGTVLIAALTALAPRAEAAINKDGGSSGAQFLKLGAGARAGGMADSFSALADDVHAVYYNPAGLAQLKGMEVAGAHTSFIQDMNYEALEAAAPLPFDKQEKFSRHTLALGIYYLSVAKVEKRATDTSDAVGTFDATDGSYGLSYAYGFNRQLSVGASAKLISERIDTYHSDSFAADLGLLYKVNPDGKTPVAVSAVLRNWGTRVSYARGESDPLPVSVTFGLGAQVWPERLRVNVETTKYRDIGLFGALGAEYTQPFMNDMKASARLGYTSHYKDIAGLNGLAMGMGVTFRVVSFDFAWLPYGNLGDTFRYSLLLKF